MKRWCHAGGVLLAIGSPAAGSPRTVPVRVPASTLGAAAEAIALQTGSNVVLADLSLWSRPTPKINGRHTAESALRVLARATQVRLTQLGPTGWRLEAAVPRPPRRPRTTAAPPPLPPPAAEAEVVVIGSKRDTPIGRLAIASERLTDLLAGTEAGTEALVHQTTTISTTFLGAGREKVFLRGIADSSFTGQAQSVTGLYFGDLRLGYNASDPNLLLYDVESVEVLPGPQGTLYGSGSLGGIVRINPRAPEAEAAGGDLIVGASATADGEPGADVAAMLNVPLGHEVTARLLGYARREGGYVDKPGIGRDVNRTQIIGGRATVRWSPVPDWTIDAVGMAQTIQGRDGHYGGVDDPLVNDQSGAEPFGSRYRAGHLVAAGRVGGLMLTSSTGAVHQTQDTRFDGRLDAGVRGFVDLWRDSRLILHESRLAKRGNRGAGWVVGVGYVRSRAMLDTRLEEGVGVPVARVVNRMSELAMYGEGVARVAPFLLVGGGARLAAARLDALSYNSPAATVRPRKQYWLLPSVSVVADLAHSVSVFSRYQQGVRPGLLVAGQGSFSGRVNRDRLSALELGIRVDRPGRLTAQLSASHSRWRDIQADYFQDVTGVFASNIGDGRIVSISGTGNWRFASGWSLQAAATLNHSRLGVPAPAPVPGVADLIAESRNRRIPNVADVVARMAVRGDGPSIGGGTLRGEAWVRYEGKSQAVVGTQSVGVQGGYVLTGVNVSLMHRLGTLSVAIDNLLDDRSTRFVVGSPVQPSALLPTALRPRTLRLGVSNPF